MRAAAQRHKITKIHRFNQKIIEYILLYLSTTPTGLHSSSGLQLKDKTQNPSQEQFLRKLKVRGTWKQRYLNQCLKPLAHVAMKTLHTVQTLSQINANPHHSLQDYKISIRLLLLHCQNKLTILVCMEMKEKIKFTMEES